MRLRLEPQELQTVLQRMPRVATMDKLIEPIKVGETVARDGYAAEDYGVVVERLDDEYVRVLWDDIGVATVHRQSSLKRVIGASRRRH